MIFNMEKVGSYPDRKGTLVDGNLLKQLFTKMHFDVMHLHDYTAEVCFCSVYSLFYFREYLRCLKFLNIP